LYGKNGFILKTNYFIEKNKDKVVLEISQKTESRKITIPDIKDAYVLYQGKKRYDNDRISIQFTIKYS
jgi:hypothetical protein